MRVWPISLALLFTCTHQLEHVQRLDNTQTTKSVDERQVNRGPSKRTDPYTDESGKKHPGTTEYGAISSWARRTGGTTTDTHWYDKLKTKWKFGLPLWLWLSLGGIAVCAVMYIFHHFTIIGRLKALWSKVRGPTQDGGGTPPG